MNLGMNSYQFFDYRLDSTLEFPELNRFQDSSVSGSAATITLTGVEHRTEAFQVRHRWEDSDMLCSLGHDRYRLSFPELLDARIDVSVARIEYQVTRDSEEATVRHLILDQVIPRLLSHRGELVLHGSCVTNEETTIAFVGASGAGKSSMAASFSEAGWKVLSDDCLLIRLNKAGAILVHGSYPGLRLHKPSARAILVPGSRPVMASGVVDKHRYDAASAFGFEALSLLVALEAPGALSSSPLQGADAARTLLGESYSLDPSDHVTAVQKLRKIAALIEQVPCLATLTYPRDYADLMSVKSHILDLLNL
ncbi:MAG: hypothetical protein ACI8Z1_003222 [Candidatus Azotimanducaceae bacterium]|jgi:hypothetical protein